MSENSTASSDSGFEEGPLLPSALATRKGPGRGRGQEGILEGSIPVLPTRPPTLVWEEGLVPGPGGGDINHRGAPVRVASGTKRKHLVEGQGFSPRAPGALGPTTATPGGQGWEQGIWGSGQATLQQEAPPEAALELRAQEGAHPDGVAAGREHRTGTRAGGAPIPPPLRL